MRRPGAWTRAYGAGPLHLLALLGSFALAGAVVQHVAPDPLRLRYAVWFLGAALAHDLLLFPLYALLDRSVDGLLTRHRDPPAGTINFVRVPALLSGLLLLVFAPVVLRRSPDSYAFASGGLSQDPYLGRWLAITAVLFLGSALVYVLRGRRA